MPVPTVVPRVRLGRAELTGFRTGDRPPISVVIPCFNYARFLPDSIGSALGQDGVDVQVVVVDDASTDDSLAVARSYAARDDRVVVVAQETNSGHVRAFNRGLEAVTGEFVARLDADDLLTPGSLRRAADLFAAFPEVGLVYGHPRHFTTPTPPVPRTDLRGWTVWSGRDWVAERCRRGVNCITTPEAVVRVSALEPGWRLDTRLRHAQDMEIWLRTAARSDVGRIDGPDQALHRDHDDSMSVTDCAGVLLDLDERRTVFRVLFEGAGGALAGAGELREQAMHTLADEALVRAVHAYDRGRTADAEVDALVEFARDTVADVAALPNWRALQRRQRVGPRWATVVPTFAASVVRRRVVREFHDYRWHRTGV